MPHPGVLTNPLPTEMDIRYPFLDMKRVNAPFRAEIERALRDVVRSGRYLAGPQVKAFESELAAASGAPFVCATSNGLDALRLIFRALIEMERLKPGSEVIVPANTYIASILPLTELGLKPVLVDPDPATMNLDWKKAEAAVTPRTGALLIVHLYGAPCWNGGVARRLAARGIWIVEDNAQAIGAKTEAFGLTCQKETGALAHAAAFSFYPTKNIGALGDAGAVATIDPELDATVRALANYGSDRRYHNIYPGWNCRMDETQAAVLRIKLQAVSRIGEERRHKARIYDTLLQNPLIVKPVQQPGHVWHQYVVRSDRRQDFTAYLTDHGVGWDIHYAVPPHRQPCYRGLLGGPFPVTDLLASEVVSLPIASTPDSDIAGICEIINHFG